MTSAGRGKKNRKSCAPTVFFHAGQPADSDAAKKTAESQLENDNNMEQFHRD